MCGRPMTANDLAVLNQILNPLMPNEISRADGSSEDADEAYSATTENSAPVSAEGFEDSRISEKEGVRLAENGELDAAIRKFDAAIERCPRNSSAFNNRAQALRLAGKQEEALADLEKAITLSNGVGRSACQAFVQRGMIHRLHGQEDLAREDFKKAADLGSPFAKMQMVALNPYAAMCNKMLSEVFTNLQQGTPAEQP